MHAHLAASCLALPEGVGRTWRRVPRLHFSSASASTLTAAIPAAAHAAGAALPRLRLAGSTL